MKSRATLSHSPCRVKGSSTAEPLRLTIGLLSARSTEASARFGTNDRTVDKLRLASRSKLKTNEFVESAADTRPISRCRYRRAKPLRSAVVRLKAWRSFIGPSMPVFDFA
jgi:hypothetical protein